MAPVPKGTPGPLAAAITDVTHGLFVNGMTASFLTAFFVAVAGALIALLTRKGDRPAH